MGHLWVGTGAFEDSEGAAAGQSQITAYRRLGTLLVLVLHVFDGPGGADRSHAL